MRTPVSVRAGLLALAIFILVTLPACADVPPLISYQGKLADSDGQPLRDGQYTMSFSIYSRPTGITPPDWQELNRVVDVTGGVFTVQLGAVTPLPEAGFNKDAWLQIRVEGTVLSPRVRLVSTPYTLRAHTAEHVLDSAAVTSLNSLTGNVSLVAGDNISIQQDGNNLVLSGLGIPNPLPVLVDNSPIVRFDSLQNTVKSTQSGAWNVGIVGNTVVGLSSEANTVKTPTQHKAENIFDEFITLTPHDSTMSRIIVCTGYKEVRMKIMGSGLQNASVSINWISLGGVLYSNFTTSTSQFTGSGHNSPNLPWDPYSFIFPVMSPNLMIEIRNAGTTNLTISPHSWVYLVN